MNLHERIRSYLSGLPGNQRRVLRKVDPAQAGVLEIEGKTVVDFASNDYLGLAHNPDLISRATEWAERYGAGARASRLVSGNLAAIESLESKLAKLKGAESALILGGGFQTNSTVLASLLDRRLTSHADDDANSNEANSTETIQLFTDRLCHASFHFGIAASGSRQHRYRHNDLEHLATLLQKRSGKGDARLIATESVFSMEGDQLDVSGIQNLARQHQAMLYIDEAHASGVLGPSGMGLMSGQIHSDDVVIGTFGKAFGSFGSYVACSQSVREYLINRCSGLIYSTGLPPLVLGAIDWALDVIPQMDSERAHLKQLGSNLRDSLQQMGLNTLKSDTHIVPVVLGDDQRVLDVASGLLADGFMVGAIRPPTVPAESARLRISLSAAHHEAQLQGLLRSLQKNLKIGAAG